MPSTTYTATVSFTSLDTRGTTKRFPRRKHALAWLRERGRGMAAGAVRVVYYRLTKKTRAEVGGRIRHSTAVVLSGRYYPRADGSTIAIGDNSPNRVERETALHAETVRLREARESGARNRRQTRRAARVGSRPATASEARTMRRAGTYDAICFGGPNGIEFVTIDAE